MKYYYVDSENPKERETLDSPKPGRQYTAWYGDKGEFVDVISGVEVHLRAFDYNKLEDFIRNAYHRAPYIKPRVIYEEEMED